MGYNDSYLYGDGDLNPNDMEIGDLVTMRTVDRLAGAKQMNTRQKSGSLPRENVEVAIWDEEPVIAAGGVTEAIFFTNTAGKNRRQTNMRAAGQLTFPNTVKLTEIAVSALNAVEEGAQAQLLAADVEAILGRAVGALHIEDKRMFEISDLRFLLPGMGTVTAAPPALAAPVGQSGVPDANARWKFRTPIYLKPSMSFNFTVIWPDAGGSLATISTVNFLLHVTLIGEVARAIQ